MGYDAPPLCPDGCLYRGLRVLSEPRIGVIAQMGCDAARPFVPMVVCIGDCACCLNRGLHWLRRWAVIMWFWFGCWFSVRDVNVKVTLERSNGSCWWKISA